MLKHSSFLFKNNKSQKLLHFILTLTTIFFADAVLAFWLPTYLQNTFSSALIMGIIISFSSVVGIITDFFFPQIFPEISEKKTLKFTLFFQSIFVGLLILSLQFPYWWVFILAVAAWGIYFEFLAFSSKIFVSDHVAKQAYTNVWAEISLGKSFAYLTGPIVASILIANNNFSVLMASFFAILTAQLLLSFFKDKKVEIETKITPENEEINLEPKMELNHWWTLTKKIWPIILLSYTITTIDATFWTSGTVLTEKIIGDFPLAIFLMPLYMAPMILAQIILIKSGINQEKERKATILLLINSILLFIFGQSPVGINLLIMVFFIGLNTALSFPIVESLYSELEERMGIHKKHLISLSSSTYSLAYILAPISAGLLSQLFGEQKTFSYLGIFVCLISLFILIFNKKKIIIPQQEINTWTEK
ncbi:MAG: hypothetical protein IT416_04265 [Candidatus Pacebacteria bacterium]|nr:hypothetical protein [Candidatus Paceibacterota bacterium]